MDNDSHLVLAYRGWMKSPPKILVPLLVPLGVTLLLLALSGMVSYPWLVSAGSIWMIVVGLIVSNDLHREFVWSFDRIGNMATFSVVRPPHFRFISLPLVFPPLGETKTLDLSDVRDVTVEERHQNFIVEQRVSLILANNTTQPLIRYFTPFSEQQNAVIVDKVKALLKHTSI